MLHNKTIDIRSNPNNQFWIKNESNWLLKFESIFSPRGQTCIVPHSKSIFMRKKQPSTQVILLEAGTHFETSSIHQPTGFSRFSLWLRTLKDCTTWGITICQTNWSALNAPNSCYGDSVTAIVTAQFSLFIIRSSFSLLAATDNLSMHPPAKSVANYYYNQLFVEC